jgi:hypothetical protein
VIVATAVCPSLLVAVTVYVCGPGLEVSSAPLVPVAPPESVHELIPGPFVPSLQLKVVTTVWPIA